MRALIARSRRALSLLCGDGGNDGDAAALLAAAGGAPMWGKRSCCPKCATALCFDCLQPFHPGLRCEASGAFPSCTQLPVLTEICLCHARSC
eukprot:COSAG01_NODE_3947_length_5505_cov_202.651128_5_plen_92_part_00